MNKLNNTQSINLEFYIVVDVVVVNVVVIIVVVRIFFSALISFDFISTLTFSVYFPASLFGYWMSFSSRPAVEIFGVPFRMPILLLFSPRNG